MNTCTDKHVLHVGDEEFGINLTKETLPLQIHSFLRQEQFGKMSLSDINFTVDNKSTVFKHDYIILSTSSHGEYMIIRLLKLQLILPIWLMVTFQLCYC